MFYQLFFAPQVKPWAIINYKHGIYELPHELPNDSPMGGGGLCALTRKKKKDLES